MRVVVVACLLLSACGRIGFSPFAGASDAALAGDGGDGDASTSADAACMFGSFSSPVNVVDIASGFDDYSPTLSGDGLRLIFESNRPGGAGGYDLYEATRPDRSALFTNPVPLASLNDTSNQSGPWIAGDGLTLYFTDDGTGATRLYVTTRATVDQPFESPTLVPGLEMHEGWAPELSEDGREIFFGWFVSGLDVYRATRTLPSDAFGTPALVAELNTTAFEGFVDVHPGGLEIFFESNRTGVNAVYSARRAAIGANFSMLAEVAELASTANTGDAELSRDGTTVVFSSQRPGGMGAYDVWIATRACE